MARTSAWRSALVAALAALTALACEEKVAAVGRCPELCGGDTLQVLDTVITGVVSTDTSVRGYTSIPSLPILVAADEDSFQARSLIQLVFLPKRWFPVSGDTVGVRIGSIDSVTLDLAIGARDTAVKNLRVLLYALPSDSLDSTLTYDSVPWFNNPHLMDSVAVKDDSAVIGLHQCWKRSPTLPADSSCSHDLASLSPWLPPLPDTSNADTTKPALGLAVRADTQTSAVLASSESGGSGPRVRFYVRGVPPQDTFKTVFTLTPLLDTYVTSRPPAPVASQVIAVGNQPAARAFLTFTIPSYYVDSVIVSRATLLLHPLGPPTGFRGAHVGIEALPILKYFGGKSILITDTNAIGTGRLNVGDTSTVLLEVGPVLRAWKGTNPDSLPRMVSIKASSERTEVGELVAGGSNAGANAPRLEITFVRSLKFGVP